MANSIIQDAREAFSKRGPLCDSEGFYQHVGECWNDALQMVFLFTDGIKERVQPWLLELDLTSDEQVKSIYPGQNPEIYSYFHKYLKVTQERFARHYKLEYQRHDECSLNIGKLRAIGQTLRKKGVHGVNAAAAARRTDIDSYKANPGGSTIMYEWVLKLFNPPFRPGKLTMRKYLSAAGGDFTFMGQDYQYANELAMMFDIDMIIKSGFTTTFGMHACCFYTCGGLDFMYEDNNGPFPFPWRSLMEKFSTGGTGKNALYCIGSASIRSKSTGGYTLTPFYPIYYDKAANTYSTMISGSSELIPLTKEGTSFKCEAESENFKLKLTAKYDSLKEHDNRVIDLLPIKAEGTNINRKQSSSFYLGSRQLSTASSSARHLEVAIKTGNARAFKNIYTPETNITRLQQNILDSRSEEIIITVLDKLHIRTVTDYIIKHNLHAPDLIKAIFEGPRANQVLKRRGRSLLFEAADENAYNVIPLICRYYKNDVEELLAELEKNAPNQSNAEPYPPEAITALKACHITGGRKTRKNRSNKRSTKRVTRAHT